MSKAAEQYNITFLPSNRVIKAAAGESLIKAARNAGLHINASCGGAGVCGKCRIIVEQGEVEGGWSEKLARQDYDHGYRQACITKVKSDAIIRIPEESGVQDGSLSTEVPERHQAKMHVFDLESLKSEKIFDPPVEKLCLELSPPGKNDNRADVGRVVHGLADQYSRHGIITGLPVLRKMRRALREKNFLITVTLERQVNEKFRTRMTNVQSGCWSSRNFGIAVDIGTTTIYGQLIDLNNGKVLAEEGDYNAQISYGEDVISRIIYTEKEGGLEKMRSLVLETINSIIEKLLKKKHTTLWIDRGLNHP